MSAADVAIPRVFHRIWFGGAMPDEFQRFGESFRRFHPGWELKLWNEKNLPRLKNQVAFERAKSFAQKADILRYELLFEHGGVYLDTDFECLKPLDELLRGVSCFSASEDGQWISIGILGAVPKHALLAAVIEELPRSIETQPHAPVNQQTGPLLFTRVVAARKQKRLDPDLVIFGKELFYPYGPTEPERRSGPFPQAYAVHHWAGSWLERSLKPRTDAEPTLEGEATRAAGSDEPQRLLLGFDPENPGTALAVLFAFQALFKAGDPVELGVYAYAEPSLLLLQCIQELVKVLGMNPDAMATLVLYSRAELANVPYDAAFFPTGDDVRDAPALAGAMQALHVMRAALGSKVVAALELPAAPARGELLERAARRPREHLKRTTSATQAAPPIATTHQERSLCGTGLGNGRVLVRTTAGYPILCSADDLSLTPELLTNGEYDPALSRLLETRLAPGDVACDIGANIGLFTVAMARAVGHAGHVVAYEALPQNFALLRDNLAMNYLTERATLLERAAWHETAKLTFHAPERFLGNGSLREKDKAYQDLYPGDPIRTLTVSAEPARAALERFPKIRFVKIDVEGAEYRVLLGLRELIEAGRVQTISFECLKQYLAEDFESLLSLLSGFEQKLGMRCHRLDTEGRLAPLTLSEVARHGNFTQLVLERS